MKFSNDIWKLITLLALSAAPGAPVAVKTFAVYFDRPCKLEKAIRTLELWQLLTYDPFTGAARLLMQPLLRYLSAGPTATQPVLFEHERPLDAPLAETCASEHPRVPEHAVRVLEHKSGSDPYNVTFTSNRKDVSTIKRLTCGQLQKQVSEFVGDDDFALHWQSAAFWSDAGRLEILETSLRFLRAGIKSGEIRTKTTAGKHLWNQFRHDCRAKGIEAQV